MVTDTPPIRQSGFSASLMPTAFVGLLIFLPALLCFLHGNAYDSDVWWHLKTGEWIIEHGSMPVEDVFSSYGKGNAWTAYSWLMDVVLAEMHRAFGLRGIVLFTAIMASAMTAAFYNLVRRIQPDLRWTYGLTLLMVIGIYPLLSPRSWLFSILFSIIELDLLLTAGRTGNRRVLLWLVPLFGLWANIHIQFVMGLVILGMAVAESLAVFVFPIKLADEDSRRMTPGWLIFVMVLCMAATLINPYGWRLYAVAVQLVGQSQLWDVIRELRAMNFRVVSNWIVLVVVLGAAYAMGWRRQMRLLLPMLFVMGVYLSFRSQRDMWFVLVVGLASLAYACPGAKRQHPIEDATAREDKKHKKPQDKWKYNPTPSPLIPMVVAALMIVVAFLFTSEVKYRRKVAIRLPVEAVQFVREQLANPASPLAEPHSEIKLFNSLDWGGYLIYNLPELPVSIDGRTMVHGQDRVIRHADTFKGKASWRDDPELDKARLVILPRKISLTSLLRNDPRFRMIYEDDTASVFVQGEPKK